MVPRLYLPTLIEPSPSSLCPLPPALPASLHPLSSFLFTSASFFFSFFILLKFVCLPVGDINSDVYFIDICHLPVYFFLTLFFLPHFHFDIFNVLLFSCFDLSNVFSLSPASLFYLSSSRCNFPQYVFIGNYLCLTQARFRYFSLSFTLYSIINFNLFSSCNHYCLHLNASFSQQVFLTFLRLNIIYSCSPSIDPLFLHLSSHFTFTFTSVSPLFLL